MEMNLIKVTETGIKWLNKKVVTMAVDDDELERMEDTQSSYTHIGYEFEIENLGKVLVPKLAITD